jgi:hypothetical protein
MGLTPKRFSSLVQGLPESTPINRFRRSRPALSRPLTTPNSRCAACPYYGHAAGTAVGLRAPGAARFKSTSAGRHYSSASVGVLQQSMAETRIQAAAALEGAAPAPTVAVRPVTPLPRHRLPGPEHQRSSGSAPWRQCPPHRPVLKRPLRVTACAPRGAGHRRRRRRCVPADFRHPCRLADGGHRGHAPRDGRREYLMGLVTPRGHALRGRAGTYLR